MIKVKNRTLHHSQVFEIPLVAFTLLAGIFIEILGFATESQALFVVDNLLTMLLPHWTLYINTVSWGDLCVEESLVFKIVGFEIMGKIGYITCGALVLVILTLFVLLVCNADPNGILFFCFGCVCCLVVFYIISVDIINLYCSPYIVRIVFYSKFAVSALH